MPVQNQPQSSTEITNDSIIHSIPTITNTKPQNPKMPVQDQPQSSTEITNDSIIHSIINANVNATLSPLSTTKIPRVPDLLKETHDYEKYFVPKVVSIGPYHHGNKKLEFVEKLKPAYTMKLLKDNKETLRRLYEKLGEPKRVENLRSFYEEKWTTMYCDKLFTKMMLLDSCFILYYIQYIFSDNPEYCGELKSHQIAFVHRDLFLLENQIPLEVLREVMEIIKNDCMGKIILFIEGTILAPKRPERGWLDSLLCIRNNQSGRNESDQKELMYMESNHLLHLLHRSLTKTSQASRRRCRNSCSQWQVQCVEDIRNTCSSCSQWLVRWVENTRNSCSQWLVWRWVENIRFSCTKVEQRSVQTRRVPDYESSLGLSPQKKSGRRESKYNDKRYTFRNVLELVDVGIHFKPSDSKSLAHIKFSKGWWGFSVKVELPPIVVDDITKPMLLNLIAYEMCYLNAYEAWVTSYTCLLDTLIDNGEDVKALRKAGVLENSLGSDEEVAKLFNEIGTNLVPYKSAYLNAKREIQKHYESWRNTLFSQLKKEYVKSPWAFFALLGALIALLLSGFQTYFTVWSPKSTCDDLCMFFKSNHHL